MDELFMEFPDVFLSLTSFLLFLVWVSYFLVFH